MEQGSTSNAQAAKSPTLSLAVAQPPTHNHDVEANAAEHAAVVARAGARVVVFPELSLCGYHFDADPVDRDDLRLGPLVAACDRDNVVALAGAVVESDRGRHIAMVKVTGRGSTVVYHKMNLGDAEATVFVAGSDPSVIEVDGWRLGLAICKDTGVEGHAAATARLGVDAYVAGVLEHADDADVQPQRATRIVDQHRIWVAIASFAGSTGEGFDRAAGGSAIWRPDGTLAAAAGVEVGSWATVELGRG